MRVNYKSLADLRHDIRAFLGVREEAARAAGLEPQQYLQVLVDLRRAGKAVLERLPRHSLAELQTAGPALVDVLTRLIEKRGNGPRSPQRSRQAATKGGT